MWRKVHEADLNASLSLDEIDAFRKSALDGDPVEAQIASVVQYVRGCIRSGGKATLSKEEDFLPESLIVPAMDFLRHRLLTRHDLKVNESRTKAYDEAVKLFNELRRGEFIPESDAFAAPVSNDRATAPACGRTNPEKRLLD